jgi:asparaginyl-tRNA synthetase
LSTATHAKWKRFYMKRDRKSPDKALAMDVLAPEGYGEIIRGSQREDDIELLLDVSRNTTFRRKCSNGSSTAALRQRSAFGLRSRRRAYGAWIGGIKHIRETIPSRGMIYRNAVILGNPPVLQCTATAGHLHCNAL